MMNTNELRINNLFGFGNSICKVVEIQKNCFYVEDKKGCEYKNTTCELKPIPITKKWLENLGFKKDVNISYRWFLLNNFIAFDLDDNGIKIGDSWDFGDD